MTDSGKLDLILEKVGSLDRRMDTLDNKMDMLNDKVNTLDDKVNTLDNKVNTLDDKVNTLDCKVNTLETDMLEVKDHVRHTDLIIENEIRINIQRVAEGHLDLSRILHDAMRPSSEVEMLSLRLRMLESEVRQLKAKVS